MNILDRLLRNPLISVLYLPVYISKDFFTNFRTRYLGTKLFGLKIYSNKDLREKKKANRVFIIGTSPTLNDLTDEDWKHISEHDSIGLNFSFLHQHVPTIQLVQLPYHDLVDLRKMVMGLNEKLEHHPLITVLLRSSIEYFKLNMKEHYYKQVKNFGIPKHEAFIPYRNRRNFITNLRVIKKLFNPQLIQTRGGALLSALYLSYNMGYKEIVFVGINDGNSEYFYHSPNFNGINVSKYIPTSTQKTKLHGHFEIIHGVNFLNTEDVIEIIRVEYFPKNNIFMSYFNYIEHNQSLNEVNDGL